MDNNLPKNDGKQIIKTLRNRINVLLLEIELISKKLNLAGGEAHENISKEIKENE